MAILDHSAEKLPNFVLLSQTLFRLDSAIDAYDIYKGWGEFNMTIKTNNVLSIIIAMMTLWSANFSAIAQDKVYLAEYKLYNQALAAGDFEAVTTHGYAAWQDAEKTLGDHKLKAVLAYNYGSHVLFSDTPSALPALERADELQQAGIGELPAEELELYLVYTQYIDSNRNRSFTNQLRKILKKRETSEDKTTSGTSIESAKMWLDIAVEDLAIKNYPRARESALNAQTHILGAVPDDKNALAQSHIIYGMALVIPTRRSRKDIQNAQVSFLTARNLYSPQEDVATFGKTYAAALGWVAGTGALLQSKYVKPDAASTPETIALQEVQTPPFKNHIDRPDDCKIEWKRRNPPDFPDEAYNSVGAVLIVYDINQNNRTENVQVLTEVPRNLFGSIAVESAKKWEVKAQPLDHSGCRKNIITQFTFFTR